MTLTTEFSLWFTLLCIAGAAGGSFFLYRNNNLELTGKYGKWLEWLLFGFRFLSIFTVAFLLLAPLLKIWNTKTEKPIIVIAIDGSQSITANKYGTFYKSAFVGEIKKLQQNLLDKYEVKTYTFGNTVKPDFNGLFDNQQTNINQLFVDVKTTFADQNLGGVVLATDGLYNNGNNPVYSAQELKCPVFTIAMGDTNLQKDILIRQLKFNQLVYAGNFFPLQIDIAANGFENNQSKLTVIHKGQTVYTQLVKITSSSFFISIPISIEAKNTGSQHYIVLLSTLQGEASTANNRYDVFINVIDGKQKIALVSLSPHPDVAAFKQSIEQNENYTVQAFSYNEITAAKLADYSLILFHQLPGINGEGLPLIKAIAAAQIPKLYVLGSQTGIAQLNAIEPTLTIASTRSSTAEVLPSLDPSFALFSLTEDEINTIRKFPPLLAPFGSYKTLGETATLFTQQIGSVKTTFPLIFFVKGENKIGFICGEGFWKWRLHDAALSNQKVSSDLIGKMVQYLAVKNDRSRFRIAGKKRFDENEQIRLDAEVYNEIFELIQMGDVQIEIRNENGKKFTYTFSKTEKAYALNVGILPAGNYTYEASTAIGSKLEMVKGQFAVIPLQLEFLQTTANHQLLNEIAKQSQGQLFYPTQIAALEYAIRNSETIKPLRYTQEDIKSWINLKWIFFLILALLSLEWFIRKWNGNI